MSGVRASNEMLVDKGLGGRLDRRDERLGGCGKDSMLTVFLKVFCGDGIADEGGDKACVVLSVGIEGEE